MRWFRRRYGAGPGHLLAFAACFALAAFAFSRIFDGARPWSVVLWLVAAIIVHDFVVLPLYTLVYAVARRVAGGGDGDPARARRRALVLHHLALPAALSLLLLLAWLPLVLRLSAQNYRPTTGMTEEPYLERWLAVTAALFALSAVVYALRRTRGARSS